MVSCAMQRLRLDDASSDPCAPWASIAREAGEPAPRLFEARERLFGAREPLVVFWRDRSGWCPWCQPPWLLLEAMRLPYPMRTIPMNGYLRPGERTPQEYLDLVPDGTLPALQLARGGGAPSAPLRNTYRIYAELRRAYPERYPLGDRGRHDRVVGEGGPIARLEAAMYAVALGGRPGALRDLRAALAPIDAALAEDARGPYVGGAAPSAADLQLLRRPARRRVRARVAGAAAPQTRRSGGAGARCSRPRAARRAVASRRASTRSRSSRPTRSRRAIERTSARARPPAADAPRALAPRAPQRRPPARGATRPRASRRTTPPSAHFAPVRGAAAGRPGSDAALMLDGALLTIARALLLETKGDGARDKAAAEAARTLAHAHGRAPARDAAAALGALAAHVGVPRDMAQDAARALREEAASLADALQRE